MSAASPPHWFIRASHKSVEVYGFSDASSAGFGSTLVRPDGATRFWHDLSGNNLEDASFNYRELHNLVKSIEEGIQSSELQGLESFVFTDNATAVRFLQR